MHEGPSLFWTGFPRDTTGEGVVRYTVQGGRGEGRRRGKRETDCSGGWGLGGVPTLDLSRGRSRCHHKWWSCVWNPRPVSRPSRLCPDVRSPPIPSRPSHLDRRFRSTRFDSTHPNPREFTCLHTCSPRSHQQPDSQGHLFHPVPWSDPRESQIRYPNYWGPNMGIVGVVIPSLQEGTSVEGTLRAAHPRSLSFVSSPSCPLPRNELGGVEGWGVCDRWVGCPGFPQQGENLFSTES